MGLNIPQTAVDLIVDPLRILLASNAVTIPGLPAPIGFDGVVPALISALDNVLNTLAITCAGKFCRFEATIAALKLLINSLADGIAQVLASIVTLVQKGIADGSLGLLSIPGAINNLINDLVHVLSALGDVLTYLNAILADQCNSPTDVEKNFVKIAKTINRVLQVS